MASPAYGEAAYRAALEVLASTVVPCAHCGRARATSPDHVPPLCEHDHSRVGECCSLVPSCGPCNLARGAAAGNRRRRARSTRRLAPGLGWSG